MFPDALITLASSDLHSLPLLTTLAAGFTAALVCGLLTQKFGLSPIVGYLLGGIIIGPHTPGIVADAALASQLAEVGVILLMFGVGLHFHLKDLLAVWKIAVPGAVVQSTVATVLGLAVATGFGWDNKSGLVIGMAMAVASTVVLIRVLMDNNELETTAGHAAVGWLIVEDIFTVILLVLIPALAAATNGEGGDMRQVLTTLGIAMVKLGVLCAFLLTVGGRLIRWVMVKVALLRSRELFTLTVLVIAVAVATFAAWAFGVSMALGAFLAGMAVGQSPVSQQTAADALPLRDAFAVLFFVSVGMLFDPGFLVREPLLVLSAVGIVMIGKPLAALLIVGLMGYSLRTALIIAVGLAQIGEFSFIVGTLALDLDLIPAEGMSMLIAAAILSITANPLLFRLVNPMENAVQKRPALRWLLNRRAEKMAGTINPDYGAMPDLEPEKPKAVIVGYGPVGRTADHFLRSAGIETMIIDLNMDTIRALHNWGRAGIFGDASNEEVLRQAGLAKARYLVITLPHSQSRQPLISAARHLRPDLVILSRGRFISERQELMQMGVTAACIEEAETAIALARMVLRHLGTDEQTITEKIEKLRVELEELNLL